MSATKTWRPLPVPGADDMPPLLVAFETKASEYSIQVTDMANVWAESIERKAICIRAWAENTSIDPSDTPENMTQFLQTLRSALDKTVSGHDQTSVTLSPGTLADSGDDGLKLVVSCNLAGFEPLKWPFHLTRGSSVAVAAEFSIPLVETLYSKNIQVDMLLQALKHKDSVIAKLADKLEATGTGLEHVFTALSGRKKVTREAADDKIRGLAPFDVRKMSAELRNNADQPSDATDLIQRVFGGTSALSENSITIESASLDDWWRSFNSTSSLPHRAAAKVPDSVAAPEAAAPSSPPEVKDVGMNDDNDEDDGEFQMQSTPPRFKSKRNDARTTSKQPSPPRKPLKEEHSSSQELKKTGGRLGAIGGKKAQLPPPPPRSPSPLPTPNKAAPMADNDETASETASDVDETASLPDDAASSPPAHQAAPSPKKAPVKIGGIGRIGGGGGGGKPKPTPVHDAETAIDAEDTTPSAANAPPPTAAAAAKSEPSSTAAPKRLGVIGKRIGGGTSKSGDATTVDDALRGRGTSRNASVETKRETSQERADRKREELKRELEKKAAAGPAKKKRRF